MIVRAVSLSALPAGKSGNTIAFVVVLQAHNRFALEGCAVRRGNSKKPIYGIVVAVLGAVLGAGAMFFLALANRQRRHLLRKQLRSAGGEARRRRQEGG